MTSLLVVVSGIDILVIGNYFLIKEDQDKSFAENYKDKYTLD